MVTHLCILSQARSGTTYFCDLFHRNKNNLTCLYEIYNSSNMYPCDKKYKPLFKKINKNLYKGRPLNKQSYLDVFTRTVRNHKKNYLMYKILHYQIEEEELKQLIKYLKKRTKEKIAIIHLTRNDLDRYISKEKARKIHRWTHANTTKLTIEFDKEKYEKYLEKSKKYTQLIKDLTKKHQIELVCFDYDEIHNPKRKTDAEKFQYILQKLNKVKGVNLGKVPNSVKCKLAKQDLASSYKDKITNYSEMLHYFEERGETI